MEKIDVLFVGGSFPMPKTGGSINYVSHLLTGIDDMSYVVLTSNLEPENNKEYDKNFSHRVIRSRLLAHVLDQNPGCFIKRNIILLLSIFEAAWKIVTIRPRCVFFTDFSLLCFSYFLAKSFLRFKMGLFTYSEEISQIRTLQLQPHFFLLRSILERADGIVTVCHYTKDQLCNFVNGIEEKISIIIPPVNIPNNVVKEKNCTDVVRLLTVARLEERKGHCDVLDALKRLLPNYPQIKYIIIGAGHFQKEIEQRIKELGLESVVEMKGRVSDAELEYAYNNSDIFVMPHKLLKDGDTEGCPTVFLEAGLHFLPVIGGEAGGVKDAIKEKETGFVCHIGTDELYDYLDQLIKDQSLRRDLAEKGYHYASQYTTKEQGKKFKLFLNDLLNS